MTADFEKLVDVLPRKWSRHNASPQGRGEDQVRTSRFTEEQVVRVPRASAYEFVRGADATEFLRESRLRKENVFGCCGLRSFPSNLDTLVRGSGLPGSLGPELGD